MPTLPRLQSVLGFCRNSKVWGKTELRWGCVNQIQSFWGSRDFVGFAADPSLGSAPLHLETAARLLTLRPSVPSLPYLY